MFYRVLASAIFISLFAICMAQARPIHFARPTTTGSGISHTERVATGDFNHDGKPDLAISSTYNQVAVFLGNGDGTFTGPAVYNLTFYVTGSVTVGDFNSDGRADLAVVGGDTSGNGLAFLSGNGDGTFNLPVYFSTGLAGASISAVAVDLNHDRNLDLFVGGNGSSQVILGDGKGNFQNGEFEGVYGFDVAVGDFNHDGNLDVAATDPFPNFSSTSVSVLPGNGDGTFQLPQPYGGLEEPIGIASGDFNGDQQLDLAVADYVFYTVVILQGNSDGTFTNIGQWFAGVSPGSVAASDFNADGKLDLAISDYDGVGVAILAGKGDGTFPLPTYRATGAGPFEVVAVDLNHDGSSDLVVVNNLDDTFSVLLNEGGARVTLTSSPNPSRQGQAVNFTGTVQGTVITSPAPSGNVVFREGATVLGSAALNNGVASFSTSTLSQGTHKIVATYSGDSIFNPNRSSALVQKVK